MSALRKPRRGDRVTVLWEDRHRSFSGTLGAMIVGATWQFELKYDDGYDILEDLDNVHWRFESCSCAGPWYEPGDLADEEEEHKDRSYRGRVSKPSAQGKG